MIKSISTAIVAGALSLSAAPGLNSCQPAPPTSVSQSIPSGPYVSFPGRSAVRVYSVHWSEAQRHLDAGRVVEIAGGGSYIHLAGHYSSHGSVFRAAGNLRVGHIIGYQGRRYRVVGEAVYYAGQHFNFRRGLTIQHSLGGGRVRLVYANPA